MVKSFGEHRPSDTAEFRMAVLQPNRERTLKLRVLNPFITCEICRGYLIKPTTITECLHTFCRTCILKYLQEREENDCPTCSQVIHETNPHEMLRTDQTLEDIIYKLIPGLQQDELRKEREFYDGRRFEENKANNAALEEPCAGEPKPKSSPCDSCVERKRKDDNFHRDDPQIGVCLQCCNDSLDKEMSVRELTRKYIRCSSRLTIAHLKKYLKVKLCLSDADQVEVMCNGEIMGKDHTLEFVYMTRWRVKDGAVLTLEYRPRTDFM